MLVRFTKNAPEDAADTLTCIRTDGTTTTAKMPRQGILPHEAFHFVVETTLSWRDAFFGHIRRGHTIEEFTAKLHGAQIHWVKMPQALQTEALIECLQADQWSGAADPAAFAQKLVAECRRRSVSPPDITPEELDNVRGALRDFGAAWRPLQPGAVIERAF